VRTFACPIIFAAALAGCAPSQQALLASGGTSDFKAMGWVAEEYGDGSPDATIETQVGDQEKPFKIFVSKKSSRIMVQNGLNSEIAGAAFTRGLTGGIANSDLPDRAPYEVAAKIYLAEKHGPDACKLWVFSPVARIGYDFSYDCGRAPATSAPRAASKRVDAKRID
jgi:hypothetical protein